MVPNQSLSLREILKRFVRREALPVMHEGVYEERFGDLEKKSKQDITVLQEDREAMEATIRDHESRQRRAKVKADMDAAARSTIVPPVQGVEPLKSPPTGA